MNINEQVKIIHDCIFHHRLSHSQDYSSWQFIPIRFLRGNLDKKIKELLEAKYVVSSGYYCTAIRGFHEYYLMYKPLTGN